MQKPSYFDFKITITMLFAIILSVLSPTLAYDDQQLAFANQTTMTKNQINNNDKPANGNSNSTTPKVAILNFYDDDIGQFTNAKPILDKYGFKGTFLIVCKWAGSDNSSRMTWQDISELYREGHDIESHTMTHKVLEKLSASVLDYEIGQAKQCIHDHLGVYLLYFLLHTTEDGIMQL